MSHKFEGAADPQAILNVVIVKENSELAFRRAVLDTGSEVNLIADKALEGLPCVKRRPWNKAPLDALGRSIHPIAEVLILWRVRGKTTLYSTWFAVMEEDNAKTYDMLLGNPFITENGFYRRNPAVWKVNHGTTVSSRGVISQEVLSESICADNEGGCTLHTRRLHQKGRRDYEKPTTTEGLA
jgi:hypothetical protein